MAHEERMIGNAVIIVTDSHFSDGHTYGYLSFYDERCRPVFPLTSQTVCSYLLSIVNDLYQPDLWKVGCLVGWIEAMLENDACTFTSMLPVVEGVEQWA